MRRTREERYEMVYIARDGAKKRCYPRSRAKLNENLQKCKANNIKVLYYIKLYPFNTMRNQHNFELISNITYNAMYDMMHGETKWDYDEYERLRETHDKAVKFECMDLPIAWVPWETYCEMKEMAAGAECHRDAACARAREKHGNYYSGYDDDMPGDDDYDRDDYSPSCPWKAPGMRVSDFVR